MARVNRREFLKSVAALTMTGLLRWKPLTTGTEDISVLAGSAPRGMTIHVVASAADSGRGTLRRCLGDAVAGDMILFDQGIFPPENPATIMLASELPHVTQGTLTIDSCHASVVIDGRRLTKAVEYGLRVDSNCNVVRGLQVVNFSAVGIGVFGDYNLIERILVSCSGRCGVEIFGSCNVFADIMVMDSKSYSTMHVDGRWS